MNAPLPAGQSTFPDMQADAFGPPGAPVCWIYRAGLPETTTFLTPDSAPVQAGYIVHPAGHAIARHTHRRMERTGTGVAEVLLVMRGRCEVDIYDDARTLLATTTLSMGDVLVMVGGGHGFRMLEPTVLLEVKPGPYPGPSEKEVF